jgi:hypothetical protein
MQIEVSPVSIKNFLYLESRLPDNIFKKIQDDVEYILNNQNKMQKYNKSLAGNLEKEFGSYKSKEILNPILQTIANECYMHFTETKETFDWEILDIWTNYQKKYEYNPLHKHSGDLSFVLWVKIPYDLEEELNLENAVNSNNPSNSLFNFVYSDNFGRITSYKINLDKSFEGKIVMFPSHLNHIVYPFYTSDDYRISISGNLIKSNFLKQKSQIQTPPKGFYNTKSNNLITY